MPIWVGLSRVNRAVEPEMRESEISICGSIRKPADRIGVSQVISTVSGPEICIEVIIGGRRPSLRKSRASPAAPQPFDINMNVVPAISKYHQHVLIQIYTATKSLYALTLR